jgi:hypothetical protein
VYVSGPDETAALLREWANFHQRKAHELATLAFKIEEAPEGVRVTSHFNGLSGQVTVTFTGPSVSLREAV